MADNLFGLGEKPKKVWNEVFECPSGRLRLVEVGSSEEEVYLRKHREAWMYVGRLQGNDWGRSTFYPDLPGDWKFDYSVEYFCRGEAINMLQKNRLIFLLAIRRNRPKTKETAK